MGRSRKEVERKRLNEAEGNKSNPSRYTSIQTLKLGISHLLSAMNNALAFFFSVHPRRRQSLRLR